jgi:hypothetical protein
LKSMIHYKIIFINQFSPHIILSKLIIKKY